MVIRRMLVLVGRRERTPVSPMQAKLGERKFVKGGSIRYLDADDRQQKRLHNKRIDNRRANQPSPETPQSQGSAVLPNPHDRGPYTGGNPKFKPCGLMPMRWLLGNPNKKNIINCTQTPRKPNVSNGSKTEVVPLERHVCSTPRPDIVRPPRHGWVETRRCPRLLNATFSTLIAPSGPATSSHRSGRAPAALSQPPGRYGAPASGPRPQV
jgi:hypothetical protein